MKEQNKPETVNTTSDRLEQAATEYYNKWRFIGGTVIKPAFIDGGNFMATQMYTAAQCEKMLEALRQRCAEEAEAVLYDEYTALVDKESIYSIPVHQFIPPLTKQ